MKAFRHIAANLEEYLGAMLLLGVCMVTLLTVGSRYVFNAPFSWAEELATLLFAWLVMMGSALALKERQHFAVTMIVEKLPGRWRRAAQRITSGLSLTACLILCGYGLVYASWGIGVATPSMGISRVWLYAAVPCGAALMSIRAASQLWQDWNGTIEPSREGLPE